MGVWLTFFIGVLTCVLTAINIHNQSEQSIKNRRKSIIEREVMELKDLCQDISNLCSIIISLKSLTEHTDLKEISKMDIDLLERDLFKSLNLISLKINEKYDTGKELCNYIEGLIKSYENYFLSLKYRKFKKNDIEFDNKKNMNKELKILKEHFVSYKEELNYNFYKII